MALKIPIPKEGDTLTINGDIITIGGQIIFEKGEKVIISDVVIEAGHYSRLCPDIFYPDRLVWIKLEGHYGLWQPDTFEELCEKM
ncbi:MAG: hypothetical protein WC428_02470 [Candidatus Paceibacterota bacterium]